MEKQSLISIDSSFLHLIISVLRKKLANNMNFSKRELIDMMYILGECHKNSLLASRVYKERYPERRYPREESFRSLSERFDATGSVEYVKRTRQKPALTEENEFTVMIEIVENPHSSARKLSTELGISRTTLRRIIKKNKYHPYHVQLHQELDQADFEKREHFCHWITAKINERRNFLNTVMFSDEATFHNNGSVNRYNFHYYADENPHFLRTVNNQHRWSINVWGGIIDNFIIGPFFFEGTLTGPVYLNFLENNLPQLLDYIPDIIRQVMWYQQDGAPPHYAVAVREWLNQSFPNQWIGRGGPVSWPPRSPDITPLDYFLWGHVKGKVYQEPPTTRDDMKRRIREAFASITPQIMASVRESFCHRIQICIEQHGRHFEHLL